MFESRYRKFVAQRSVEIERGVDVFAADDETPIRMSADDYALALLFDGQRDADTICALARDRLGRALSRAELEGFAAELVRFGLLRAGADEPLPPPVHTPDQARVEGWRRDGIVPAVIGPDLHPPSSVAGGLSAPGLLGGLTGLIGRERGRANRPHFALDPGAVLWLGRLLIWPLRSRATLALFAALVAGALIALYTNRLEAIPNVADSIVGYRPLWGIVAGAMLVNLFASAARAAALERYTPGRIGVGIVIGFLGIPRLFVDTAGAAEHAGRSERMRIIGSGLVGIAALLSAGILVWFLSMPGRPVVAAAALAVAAVAAVVSIFMINPLPKRDGYYLLAHALSAPDLREQAASAVFGYSRPWFNQAHRLPRAVLRTYAVAIVVYWVFVISMMFAYLGQWLGAHFNGIGFLILVMVLGAYMYRQFGKTTSSRNNLGWTRDWSWIKRSKWIIGGIVLLCLLPYRYEPSGEFLVLPQDRADVRALVSGDVREVLVEEGDEVQTGDVIARLADEEQRARVAASEAELAQLQADLSLARKGGKPEEIEVAKQQVETARKRAEVARANAKRLAQAYSRRAVTAQEYDHAQGQADVAEQELVEAQRSLDLVSSPATPDRIAAIEAQLREAEATLRYNQQQLKATRIAAPISGRVVSSSLMFAVGDYLNRGELLAVIEDTSQWLVEIKLPETGIGEVEVGKPAYAKAWAYPGTTFDGAVRSIAPAAEDGRYGKVVRVTATIDDPDDRLKSGMTGNAKVQGDWHLLIVVFTRALTRFLFVEVWSWLP